MREQAILARSRRNLIRAALGGVIVGGLAIFGGACSSREPANVVLITLDTTRADRLGCYGCAIAQTPALDAFAREAVVFENAVTAVPLTLPSHTSIMTGCNPPEHGVRNNASFKLGPEGETLAERFAAAGYQCAAFVSSPILARTFGLDQGFATYDDAMSGPERSSAETTQRAVSWLSSARPPFFLWVHYFDPHTPWDPPEPFASQTRGQPYDAEISAMDASVGELLAALKRDGYYDRVHIMIVGDHGEGLGDHHEIEHGILLYEETLRVPLIWRLPGGRAVRRVTGLAGTIDVAPTLLDMLSLEPLSSAEGISLRSAAAKGEVPQRDGLYAETLYPYYSYGWSPLYAWRAPQSKYVKAPQAELYDLARDPGERENIVTQRAATAETLRGQLAAYRSEHGWQEGAPAEGDVDPRVAEQLTSLGYIMSGRKQSAPSDSLPDPKTLIATHEHFELGKLATQEGRFADAIEDLKFTLDAYPDNHAATYFMGLALVRAGRPAEALTWLDRHLKGGAPEPNATLIMGDALLDLGRPSEALEWYRRHIQTGPQVDRAIERSGDALFAMKRYDEALATYRQTGMSPVQPALARKRARTLVRLGRYSDAAGEFRSAANAAAADQQPVFRELADDADLIARLGLSQPAADDESLTRQVRAAAALGLEDQGARLIAATRGSRPESLRQLLQGDVAIAKQSWGDARRSYARAEELGLRSSDLYLRFAKACVEMGDLRAAQGVLERGIGNTADEGGYLRYNLACVYARQNQAAEACRLLEEARQRGRFTAEQVRADSDLAPFCDDPCFVRVLADSGR